MRTPALFREIGIVLQANFIGAIIVSVESVVESIIYQQALHNSKIRKLNDSTANDEMFIAVNGPELGEADALLAKSLDIQFAGKSNWHSTKQTLFRTRLVTSGVVGSVLVVAPQSPPKKKCTKSKVTVRLSYTSEVGDPLKV